MGFWPPMMTLGRRMAGAGIPLTGMTPLPSELPAVVMDAPESVTASAAEPVTAHLTFRIQGLPLGGTVKWAVEAGASPTLEPAAFEGGVYPSGTVSFPLGSTDPVTVDLRLVAQTLTADASVTIRLSEPVRLQLAPEAETATLVVRANATSSSATVALAAASPAFGSEGQVFTFTFTPAGDASQARSLSWGIRGTGSNAATPDDFAGNAWPSGTLAWAAGDSSAKTATVALDSSLVTGSSRGAELYVSSVLQFAAVTATAPFTVIPPTNDDWSLVGYAARWQLFNPDAGSVTQLATGVLLTAATSNKDIWLLSKTQASLAAGFTAQFDMRVRDANAESGSGTFFNLGLVRGDGSVGWPVNVANWTSSPTETNLEDHATGFRATFANQNGGSPSLNNEFRIRVYENYSNQMDPADSNYNGNPKITLAKDTLYSVTIRQIGTTVAITVANGSTQQFGLYEDPTLAMVSARNIMLRCSGGRSVEILNFRVGAITQTVSGWEVPTEEPLPPRANLVPATPANLADKIAAAKAGDHIQLADGDYGAVVLDRQIGAADSAARAVLVAANRLGAKLTRLTVKASGWTVSGLDFPSGTVGNRINVQPLGVTKGYFRITRCRWTMSADSGAGEPPHGFESKEGSNWTAGGMDYCTGIGSTQNRLVFINTYEAQGDGDLLIHHNHWYGFKGGADETAHGIFLGTDDRAAGFRIARVLGFNLVETGTRTTGADEAYCIEIKGSRTLVINNLSRGDGDTGVTQHRNGYFCDWVGNVSEAKFGMQLYGYGDAWIDNEVTHPSATLRLKTGNFSPADWVGAEAPPSSGMQPDRYTDFYDRYKDEFAWRGSPLRAPTRGETPSPRPAATQSLFVGNKVPNTSTSGGLVIGHTGDGDKAGPTSTVRCRFRPASYNLLRDHTGKVTFSPDSYSIPGVAAKYQGPWPAHFGTVDQRTLDRPTVWPDGYRNAGRPFPAKYVPVPLVATGTSANVGVDARV